MSGNERSNPSAASSIGMATEHTQQKRPPLASHNNDDGRQNKRKNLQSMGPLMDFDDAENHMENRPRVHNNKSDTSNITKNAKHDTQTATRRTGKHQSGPENSANKNDKQKSQAENENESNNNKNDSSNDDAHSTGTSSSSMVRSQHRHRLMVGGQVAASILTPHNNAGNNNLLAMAVQPPAWDEFVRKGTQLRSLVDDALQHVATGYAVTHNLHGASNKRQRVEQQVDGSVTSSIQQDFIEREQVAASMAKDKTKEVLLLQQVRAKRFHAIKHLLPRLETQMEPTRQSSNGFVATSS